jgi:Uma2 family endonuclease
MTAFTLNLNPIIRLTDEQFYQLCQVNQDLSLERNPQGELIIVSPVGGVSGNREADLLLELGIWNRRTKLGKVFSSSTLFKLPGGGDRSPDAAWIRLDRWEALPEEDRERFPLICPDFVIELRSRTDRLQALQAKMQEYLDSGLHLGWLIDPQQQQAEIYRSGQGVEVVQFPVKLSGEGILPGFRLRLP